VPLLGVSNGVAKQIEQDLPELALVGLDEPGQSWIALTNQGQGLPVGPRACHGCYVVQEALEIEAGRDERKLAGLDRRQFQHVIDQFQQMPSAAAQDPQIVPVAWRELPYKPSTYASCHPGGSRGHV
jgi:hypothetical protein